MYYGLSKRELQVLRELINGETNNIIADKLYISKATVKAHISSLIQKFKAKNRVELAVMGVCFLLDQLSFDE